MLGSQKIGSKNYIKNKGDYAEAFKKVVRNYKELLADDPGDSESLGGWNLSNAANKKDLIV